MSSGPEMTACDSEVIPSVTMCFRIGMVQPDHTRASQMATQSREDWLRPAEHFLEFFAAQLASDRTRAEYCSGRGGRLD